MNIPQIISHRGDLRAHPENTLAAFERALSAGIRHVEIDLQINAAGTPVVLHDPNLSRTYGTDRSVFELADGELPALPTLVDVLDLADKYPGAVLYLEIKHDSLGHWGEALVLEKLLPWADRIKAHVLLARSTDFLRLARQAGLPTIGVILRQWSEGVLRRMSHLSPDFLVINVKLVPPGEPLWPGPWKWAVYKIADLPTALHWAERGADFVLSHFAVQLYEQRQARASD